MGIRSVITKGLWALVLLLAASGCSQDVSPSPVPTGASTSAAHLTASPAPMPHPMLGSVGTAIPTESSVVMAVRYGTSEGDSEHTQTLAKDPTL